MVYWFLSLTCSTRQPMKIKLGIARVTAIDDGGISLCADYKMEIPPVFSIEVVAPCQQL